MIEDQLGSATRAGPWKMNTTKRPFLYLLLISSIMGSFSVNYSRFRTSTGTEQSTTCLQTGANGSTINNAKAKTNTEKKIIVLVHSGPALFQGRADQRQSCRPHYELHGVQHVFAVARPSFDSRPHHEKAQGQLATPKEMNVSFDLLKEVEEHGDVLIFAGRDYYRDMSDKLLNVLKYGVEQGADYIFKSDDEYCLNVTVAQELIKKHETESPGSELFVGGYHWQGDEYESMKGPNGEISRFFSGALFGVSKELARLIVGPDWHHNVLTALHGTSSDDANLGKWVDYAAKVHNISVARVSRGEMIFNLPVIAERERKHKEERARSKRLKDKEKAMLGGNPITRKVHCGNHEADSCRECPQGQGASWCNGECNWCPLNNACMSRSDHDMKCTSSVTLADTGKQMRQEGGRKRRKKQTRVSKSPGKNRCFVFWFGPPMQKARKEAFMEMKSFIEQDGDVVLELVTNENLLSYQVPEWPIHPAALLQPGLSGNHRSDYLRGYFMHNHGGCYHDVKKLPRPPRLGGLFERMDKNESIYMIGAPEGGAGDVGCDDEYARQLNVTCAHVVSQWQHLLSNGMYMARKNTPFTKLWLTMVEQRLSQKFQILKKHPSPSPGRCCQNQDPKGYPFYWTEVHGSLLHPLMAVYGHHLQAGFPWFDRGANYRSEAEDVATQA